MGRLADASSRRCCSRSASSSRSSIGGLTGVMLASPTLDFHLSDTYFVVAHFHYVMGGTVVFALFAAIYFWWPKVTGRMLSPAARHDPLLAAVRRLQHDVLRDAPPRPRRHAAPGRRLPAESTTSSAEPDRRRSARSILVAVVRPVRRSTSCARCARPPTAGADPWEANSLEWATSSPPPEHNFTWLPPIRSERPVFDLRWSDHPDIAAHRRSAAALAARRGGPRVDGGAAVKLEMVLWAGVTVYFTRDRGDLLGRRRRPGRRLAAAHGHRARRPRRRLGVGLAPAPPPRPVPRTAPTATPPTPSGSSASTRRPACARWPSPSGITCHRPRRRARLVDAARRRRRSSPPRSPCSSGTPTGEPRRVGSPTGFWARRPHRPRTPRRSGRP